MNKRETIEAIFAGLARGLLVLAVDEAAVVPARPPAKSRRPRGTHPPSRTAAIPPALAREIIPQAFPQPNFDPEPQPVQDPMPGFEGVPAATLAAMEKAVESITRGNGVPPGFYDPQDGPSVPLS